MKELSVAASVGRRRWLCLAALTVLSALLLWKLPFLLEVWSRAVDWLGGVFAHMNKPWEELTWFR